MNLKPFLLALPLACALPVAAQQSVGIQAGVGWSKVDINLDKGGYSQGPLLNLGVSYERFLKKHLTLGADLLYQQRGSKDPVFFYDMNGQPVGTANLYFRYNYLALPIKVGYTAGRKGFAFGKIGIMPAVLLKAAFEVPAYVNRPREIQEFTAECNRFELGGIAELGGGVRFGQGFQFYGSLGYQHSLTRIAPEGLGLGTQRYEGWNLNLGLRYELPARKAAPEKR